MIYPETPTGYGKTLSVTLNRYKEKTVAPDSEQITIIGSDDLKGFESIAVAQIELNRLRKPKTRKKPYLSTFSLINKAFNKCLWATKKIFLPFLRMNSNSHNMIFILLQHHHQRQLQILRHRVRL